MVFIGGISKFNSTLASTLWIRFILIWVTLVVLLVSISTVISLNAVVQCMLFENMKMKTVHSKNVTLSELIKIFVGDLVRLVKSLNWGNEKDCISFRNVFSYYLWDKISQVSTNNDGTKWLSINCTLVHFFDSFRLGISFPYSEKATNGWLCILTA